MKRGRDGSIRENAEGETRARTLAALRLLVCPVLYSTISTHPTKVLLDLVATLRPEQRVDGTDAGTG
jgi:hypothetical protein